MSKLKNVASLDGTTSPVTKAEEPKASPLAIPEREDVSFAVPSTTERRAPTTPDENDPFNPTNLRIDQSYLNQPAAKRLLTTIPVRKPGKQDFVRVHPSPDYRITVALIELEEDREVYVILPPFLELFQEGEFYLANLFLTINRQKTLRFWPVKLSAGGRQNTWHTSAAEAAEKAMHHWMRITANQDLGAYEMHQSERDFGEPVWPPESLHELLKIAFKNRMIDHAEHPVLQKLRGRI